MTDPDIPVVETERLILRGFRETDLDGLFALARDPLIAGITRAEWEASRG